MDWLGYYAIALGALFIFALGIAAAKKDKVDDIIFTILMFLPLAGRVWGWW